MACKRNLGNVSQSALMRTLDLDYEECTLTRQAVSQWELRLSSAILLQAQGWRQAHYEYIDHCWAHSHHEVLDLRRVGRGPFFTYEVHSVLGDATNSAVKHSHKAHLTCVRSFFEVDAFRHHPDMRIALEDVERPDPGMCQEIWPDLQMVPHSNRGLEQRLIFMKQLEASGTRVWNHALAAGNRVPGGAHIQVFVFATDQGPDQKAARNLIVAETDHNDHQESFGSGACNMLLTSLTLDT